MATQSKQKKMTLNPNKIVVTVPWQAWSLFEALKDRLDLQTSRFYSIRIVGDLYNDNDCVGQVRLGHHGDNFFKVDVGVVEEREIDDHVSIGDILDARMRFHTKAEAEAWIGDIESVTGPLSWTYDENKWQLRFSIKGEQTDALYHGNWKVVDARKARLAAISK